MGSVILFTESIYDIEEGTLSRSSESYRQLKDNSYRTYLGNRKLKGTGYTMVVLEEYNGS